LYPSVGILPVWFTWKYEQTNTESSNKNDNPPFKRQAGTNKIECIAYLTENTKHISWCSCSQCIFSNVIYFETGWSTDLFYSKLVGIYERHSPLMVN